MFFFSTLTLCVIVLTTMVKYSKSVPSQSCPPQKKNKLSSLPSSSLPSSSSAVSLPHLNDDILHNIFTLLPIKYGVQSCAVSTSFKRSWTHNRKLVFASEFGRSTESLVALVDHVFDSHEGPEIQSFQIHISHTGVEGLIEKWLKICISKKIEELDLNFIQTGYVLVPEFLEIQTLKVLKLFNVEIAVPPVINGWQNLHTVVLRCMELCEEQVENVMLYGKLIECLDLGDCEKIKRLSIFASNHKNFTTLKIVDCRHLEIIEIDSPTLRRIHYRGFVINFQFNQAVPLDEANFIFHRCRNYLKSSIVKNLVNYLLPARVLTTSAQFQEALASRLRDGVFREPTFCFSNVRELHMVMIGGSFCNPYDIVMFAKNCPNVEMLFIDLNDYHFECGLYWEMHQKPMLNAFNHYFDGLRVIKFNGFKFLQSELQLLEILLKRSRFLEALIFVTQKNSRIKIYQPLMHKYEGLINSWKSPTAKVAYFEHAKDKSGIHPSHQKNWY